MSGQKKSKCGIKAIAEQAGVSIGTVDRVLHNRGEVKAETREKVMRIVKEMGYTPNPIAKALSSKKAISIAAIIPDSSDNNPYWQKPDEGIKLAANELQMYNVQIVRFYYNATSQPSFAEALNNAAASKPDGVLLCPSFNDKSMQFVAELDNTNTPYVFVDINLKDTGNIGYFGQDAYQSGIIAARLMRQSTGEDDKILIVKQANGKVFSDHIESRVSGFKAAMGDSANIRTIEIDLCDDNEPALSISPMINAGFKHIFVPNSRAFVLADLIEKSNINYCNIIGYDLINENVKHLKRGTIKYLLNQRPDEQSYKAIMRLFNCLNGRPNSIQKNNYSPIDIIIKENVDYYATTWTE